jgi:hypothetical protein
MHDARKEASSCGVSVVFSGEICPIFQQKKLREKMEKKFLATNFASSLLFFFFLG